MNEADAETIAPKPGGKRPVPWVVFAISAAVIVFGVWMVRAIIRDTRGEGSEPEKGEPILGLSDPITRQREAELDTLRPKTAPSASSSGAAAAPTAAPASSGPVGDVVREHIGAFRACYEKSLAQDPKTPAAVSLAFELDEDGSARDVRVVGASATVPVFQECLVGEVAKLRFAAPADGHKSVVYPFDFASKP